MTLQENYPKIAQLIQKEEEYQKWTIRLIASENYQPELVTEAISSVYANKYSEGYPHTRVDGIPTAKNGRYYQWQMNTNEVESLSIDEALNLFVPSAKDLYHANVQSLSWAPANLAIQTALLDVWDTLMWLSLDFWWHLTHGHKVSVSSKFFKSIQYPLGADNLIDYDLVEELAIKHKPKLIIAWASAYPREIDFQKFGLIAKKVWAYLLADISHISWLVTSWLHPHPFPHADVVMTTTHKILRWPRSAVIICRKDLWKKIDRAVFPSLQWWPHMNTIAWMLVCFLEAQKETYKEYAQQVIDNAVCLWNELKKRWFSLVSGWTDTHLLLINIKKSEDRLICKDASKFANALEVAGIILNKNSIPGDPKPWLPSGIRIWTPAVTTLWMKQVEMLKIAARIEQVSMNVDNSDVLTTIRADVEKFMLQFA